LYIPPRPRTVFSSVDPCFELGVKALIIYIAERFNETIFDSVTTYLLNICEVCGSSQCPYCPIYNLANAIPVPVAVILVTCFITIWGMRMAYP
jgi:hypothetical protein